jgi:predicted esterase
MRHRTRWLLGPGLVIASCTALAQVPARPAATRADLAIAYLRFETTCLAATLDDADTVRVNRAFDALTLAFFAKDFSGAIKQLDALTSSLKPSGDAPNLAGLAAYRIRITPPVFTMGSGVPTIAVEAVYEAKNTGHEIDTLIRLKPVGAGSPLDLPVKLTTMPGEPAVVKASMSMAVKRVRPGRYEVGFSNGSAFVAAGVWSVVSKPLHATAAANAAALAAITTKTPALVQALASTSARNALLVDVPDPANTAQMLVDPEALANEVKLEVAALEHGNDPFKNRAGDYWRVLRTDGADEPLRVYRPASIPSARAMPLVVVLHGAGGDENMFMDAYGGGLIKRLADKYGFLVVSPQTTAFAGEKGGAVFDRLVEALAYDYPIDPKRIYVLGHSMGGMTAATLVAARPDRIAAAACLNGFLGFKDDVKMIPPTLVTAAELDPLVSPSRVEPAVREAQAAGLPVEYLLLRNYGHTLAVTKLLPDVVAWLMTKGSS